MTKELVVIINLDGTTEFIHDDALSGLMASGTCEITRASHVEPSLSDPGAVKWHCDMSPCGIDAFVDGFDTRQQALDYERQRIYKDYYRLGGRTDA